MAKDPLPVATHIDIARYLWRRHNTMSLGRQIGMEMVEMHRTVLRLPSPFIWSLEPDDKTDHYVLNEDDKVRAVFTRAELEMG